MNLRNSLNENDIKILENAGINVEDREYSKQECTEPKKLDFFDLV